MKTAIKIKLPEMMANTLYQSIVLFQSSVVKGDKLSFELLLLNINVS